MAVKDIWKKTAGFLRRKNAARSFSPEIDKMGLIINHDTPTATEDASEHSSQNGKLEIVRKHSASHIEKKDSIEALAGGFNRMVDQLEGINKHLNMQIDQHHKLMDRMDQLPELLENLPNAVDDQKKVVNELIDQLKNKTIKEQQFIEIIEKIPAETLRQNNTLLEMSRKLSVSADADVQMADSFNRFNETLSALDTDTVNQTDSIKQMNKTFAASDRYLKYILSKQHKNFMWVFIAAMSICGIAIMSLVAIILIVMK